MAFKSILRILLKLRVHTVAKRFRKFVPAALIVWAKENRVKKLVSVSEIKPQYEKACKYLVNTVGKNAIGDYLEFGVCHGTSINCMHQVLAQLNINNMRLFGFDSFEGMPAVAKTEDGGLWYPGQFRSELRETKYFLTKNGIDWKKTFLIKGWFSDTLTPELKDKFDIKKASVIMIDCDIYSSSKQALEFCKPLIVDKSVIIFDDWGSGGLAEKNMGERRAFEEFLSENPEFSVEDFGSYHFDGKPNGRLFVVTNNQAATRTTRRSELARQLLSRSREQFH